MIKTDAIIIGAGPTGLFAVHQLGIIGLKCEVIDNLDRAGGQCIELYPDKPIYDIPAIPECTGEELTNGLLKQVAQAIEPPQSASIPSILFCKAPSITERPFGTSIVFFLPSCEI